MSAEPAPLRSTRWDVSADPVEAWQFFYERGWCDGLPIVPPTAERVAEMLDGADPARVVARLPPSYHEATVEKIAVNAVMAGCPAGALPVLVAAVEAIVEPSFRFLPVGTTPASPALVLNGPIRRALGVNCGYACMGGMTRINTTLGRALRLVAITLGMAGSTTIPDQSTTGLPNRISFCFGENEEASPWEPYHVEHGFAPRESTVTAVNVAWAANMHDGESKTPESLFRSIAGSITFQASNAMETGLYQPFLVFGPEHARLVADAGFSKADVRRSLWELAALPLASFPPELQEKFARVGRTVIDGRVHLTETPADLGILVAGGGGPHSVYMASFGRHQTRII
jgi:hypothetical protein